MFATVDGYVRRRLRSVLQWRWDGVGKGIGATHQRRSKPRFVEREPPLVSEIVSELVCMSGSGAYHTLTYEWRI